MKKEPKVEPIIKQESKQDKLIEVFQKHFPQALQETEQGFLVDKEQLQRALEPKNCEVTDEALELRWVGKKEAYHSGYSLTDKIIQPLKEQSKDFENTGNVLIKGDNLDALKLLQKNYFERIKMIYIDPPYNTQNDKFIYRDNFTKTQEEILDELGYDKEQKEYIKNIAGAQTHSGWLSFIYPRLLLARELLRDDGVIFISIDDNEQANLKLLCDEVFGEMNFVASFIWQHRKSSQNDIDVSLSHNYKITFAKNREIFKLNPLGIDVSKFSNPDNDPRGDWSADPFDAPNIRPNLTYPITNPNTKQKFLPPEGRCWRMTKQKFEEALKDNRIIFGKTGNTKPQYKRFKSEAQEKGTNPFTIWNDIGTATEGTKELMKIMSGKKIFDTPKPTSLLQKIIKLSAGKNDIILDFFAGSGTTGDAVMRLNAEDGGNRKYVLVQLDEPIKKKNNKEAYDFVKNELKKEPTIFEIAAERLRRAGAKIEQTQQEKPQELAQEKPTLDTGFKIFALAKDKNNEIHRIKHSEQKQISTELTNSTIQNETLLYNMLLGAGITFQEKIHCLIKNTCYQAKEHLFILQQFSLGKKNEASKENEAILEKASAEYAHIYNRNITDDEFILNLTKFIKKEKITLKEPL